MVMSNSIWITFFRRNFCEKNSSEEEGVVEWPNDDEEMMKIIGGKAAQLNKSN
jgi:hypothetical protein